MLPLDFFFRGKLLINRYIIHNVGGKLLNNFVVGPSICMSSLCYSIFKLEPYQGCAYSCVYCYARNFPGGKLLRVKTNYTKLFEKLATKLKKSNLTNIPFRLSTLSDPFQKSEEIWKLSLKLLRICLRIKIPVIISTKSDLIVKEPWLTIIKKLTEQKLVVIQYTLILLNDEKSKIIEPKAPPPSKRLKAIEKLHDEGIPVIIRLQPIIPFVNSKEDFMETFVSTMKAIGAQQIIAENYRFTSWRELSIYQELIRPEEYKFLKDRSFWEYYPSASQKRPKVKFRIKTLTNLAKICEKHNLKYSTCREGLYHLHTSPNCCGMHNFGSYRLRPTLHEIWKNVNKFGSITIKRACILLESQNKKIIEKIPLKIMQRTLNDHLNILIRTLTNFRTLTAICPILRVENNRIQSIDL